jgi:hypothetical protein
MSILEQLQLGDYVQLNGAGRDLWKVVQATPGSEDHVLNPGVSIQDHYRTTTTCCLMAGGLCV